MPKDIRHLRAVEQLRGAHAMSEKSMRVFHVITLICAPVSLTAGYAMASESRTLGAYLIRYEEERMLPLVDYCISRQSYMKPSLVGANKRYLKAVRKASADYQTLITTDPELNGPIPPEVIAVNEERTRQALADLGKRNPKAGCESLIAYLNTQQLKDARKRLKNVFSAFADKKPAK